jgi:hypothetical protein
MGTAASWISAKLSPRSDKINSATIIGSHFDVYGCSENRFQHSGSVTAPVHAKTSVAQRRYRNDMITRLRPLLLLIFALILSGSGAAQMVPLVTDQTPLDLPNTFGIPGGGGIVNDRGDYAFVGAGQASVFYRSASSPAPVRVYQSGDSIPGVFGATGELVIGPPSINSDGMLAFAVDAAFANGISQTFILMFDGTSLTKVVGGNEPAPSSGGANFERGIALRGINNSGSIAFTAPLVSGASLPQTTLFLASNGEIVRLAGPGDAVSGTTGVLGNLGVAPNALKNSGEILFESSITGGTVGQGLFVASATGIRKIVANGDPNPLGGTFPAVSNGVLNNAGQIAFTAGGAVWVGSGTAVPVRKVNAGDSVPQPLGGTIAVGVIALRAFEDNGALAFTAGVTGSPISSAGLFRLNANNSIDVVAYRGQFAAVLGGQSFNVFNLVSMNASGSITFHVRYASGAYAIFQQSGTEAPVKIAQDGETVPGGVGLYNLLAVPFIPVTLADGSAFFASDLAFGSATYGEYLIGPGGSKLLMSNAEPLPPGGRTSFRSFKVSASADYVAGVARIAGGGSCVTVHKISTGVTTTTPACDNIPAPASGPGRLRLFINYLYLNDSGTVVFPASLVGSPTMPLGTAIFAISPTFGFRKIAANGDTLQTGGSMISNVSFPSLLPRGGLNNSGQVVVLATLIPGGARTLFIWSPGPGLSKAVSVGDAVSGGGGTLTSIADYAINAAGKIAFKGTTAAGTGIYIGSVGGPIVKVAATGDTAPGGSTFSAFSSISFNDSDQVAFTAAMFDRGGAFVGSPTAAPVALAQNGTPAPAGGNFSILTSPDILINNQGDVVFRSILTGGSSNSGYFVRRSQNGILQAALLQGQPAPGTAGVFDTLTPSLNNFLADSFQLGQEGDISVQTSSVVGDTRIAGVWHVRTDNTIQRLIVRGEPRAELGGGTVVGSAAGLDWASGHRYPMWVRASSGSIRDALVLINTAAAPTFGSITGRVTTPDGAAIRNAVVSLLDSKNQRRTATTSSFGVYTFANVQLDQMYTATVASKRYRFSPKTIPLTQSLTSADFIGLE